MKSTPENLPRDSYVTYKLGDITFLPHYRNRNVFVGPGYPRHNTRTFTITELVNFGAVAVEQMLWPRGEHGVINNVNL